LLYELAIHDATGVLAAEVSMLKKRLYVVGGRPVHMESNVASEELGEMLVARNMVSSGELMMAQAVLSRFDNVLERALVELSLIEPRALLAELEAQLKQSVAEVCTWTKGSATWTPSVRSPTRPKVAPLALLPILVVGAEQIDRGFLEDWARSLADATVHTIDEPPVDPARFGAGAKLAQIRSMCGDGRSMTEIRSYCPSDAAWIDTLRIVYLLAQTGLIYFGMPV
jgi:hypothetical protein